MIQILPALLNSSLIVIRISPCLFCPGHACLLITVDERVAPQPQSRSGVASTSSKSPVFKRRAFRSGFCSYFFFMHSYITSNWRASQASDVPSSPPTCLIFLPVYGDRVLARPTIYALTLCFLCDVLNNAPPSLGEGTHVFVEPDPLKVFGLF